MDFQRLVTDDVTVASCDFQWSVVGDMTVMSYNFTCARTSLTKFFGRGEKLLFLRINVQQEINDYITMRN